MVEYYVAVKRTGAVTGNTGRTTQVRFGLLELHGLSRHQKTNTAQSFSLLAESSRHKAAEQPGTPAAPEDRSAPPSAGSHRKRGCPGGHRDEPRSPRPTSRHHAAPGSRGQGCQGGGPARVLGGKLRHGRRQTARAALWGGSIVSRAGIRLIPVRAPRSP